MILSSGTSGYWKWMDRHFYWWISLDSECCHWIHGEQFRLIKSMLIWSHWDRDEIFKKQLSNRIPFMKAFHCTVQQNIIFWRHILKSFALVFLYHRHFPDISKTCSEVMMLQTYTYIHTHYIHIHTTACWWLWVNPRLLPVSEARLSALVSLGTGSVSTKPRSHNIHPLIFRSWSNQCLAVGCDDTDNRLRHCLHSLIPVCCCCLGFNLNWPHGLKELSDWPRPWGAALAGAGAMSTHLWLSPDQFCAGSITLASLPLPLFSSHFLPRFLRYRSPWWKSKQNTILWT